MAKEYFTHTPRPLSDANQVENLAIETEEAFLKVGTDMFSEAVVSASIGSSIGELDNKYVREYYPGKGIIENYVQELYFPVHSKEASLELVPDTTINSLNTVVIKNRLDPSQVYTYKHDGLLESDTEFCFLDRKIIIGKTPANDRSLSITYNGYQPVDAEDEGLDLRFNVLQTVDNNGLLVREFPVVKTGDTYKISGFDFKNMCSLNIREVIENRPYNLDKYVTITNTERTESYYVSDISITNSFISFTSSEIIPASVSVYVANSSLGALVEGLYRLFYSHDHGVNGGKAVRHKDLVGLFTNIGKLNYSITDKENYEHPQYFNREGYTEAPEVFNNAIVGDILVANKNEANYFNNLNADSFKLIFGEHSSGHRISYSKSNDCMVLDSLSRDGLKITTPKNKKVLSLNEHTITDSNEGSLSALRLGIEPTEFEGNLISVFEIQRLVKSENGITDYVDQAELRVNTNVFSIGIVKDRLNLLSKAIINFGDIDGVQIAQSDTGLEIRDRSDNSDKIISISVPIKATRIETDILKAEQQYVTDRHKILFGASASTTVPTQKLSYNDTRQRLELSLDSPLFLVKNGRNSGITWGNENTIYSSNIQGTHSTNESEIIDFHIQTQGDVKLVKPVVDGVQEKANLLLNKLTATNINVDYNPDKLNAITLNGDAHRVFSHRDPSGNIAVSIQTNGGLNVLSSYTHGNVANNITYGAIRASEFRMSGGGDNAGIYGNIIVPQGNKLSVNGEAFFANSLELNNDLKVNGTATLNNLETTIVKAGTVNVSESIVTPLITAPLGFDSKLYIGSDSVFNNNATFRQICNFTANATFAASVSAESLTTNFLYVKSNVDFTQMTAGDVTVTSNLLFKKMLQTDARTSNEFSGPLVLKSGLTLDRNNTIRLGSEDINSTRNTSGILIKEDAIKMGNNSTIRVSKIFANKGVPAGGNSDTAAGYAFEVDSTGVADGDTGMFCIDKSGSLASDISFMINGTSYGEITTKAVDITGDIQGREKTLVTADMFKTVINQLSINLLNQVYPIGSIYENSTDDRNPRIILNWGTSVWKRYAIGRSLVGASGAGVGEQVDSFLTLPAGLNLSTVGLKFGEYEHQLTQKELPSTNIPWQRWAGRHGSREHGGGGFGYASGNTNGYMLDPNYPKEASGEDKPHNITHPVIVTHIWERVG